MPTASAGMGGPGLSAVVPWAKSSMLLRSAVQVRQGVPRLSICHIDRQAMLAMLPGSQMQHTGWTLLMQNALVMHGLDSVLMFLPVELSPAT